MTAATVLDIDPTAAEFILPHLTHWVCPECEDFDSPAPLALCGSRCTDNHTCPDDMSCGCVMCPECDDLEQYDDPCPGCEGH